MRVAAFILSPLIGAAIGGTSVQAFGLRRGLPLGLVLFLGAYGVGVMAAS